MSNREIARTILAQLGGNRFVAMTGAKNFIACEQGLYFTLPRFAGVKINRVRVTLTPADTYTVEFFRFHRVNRMDRQDLIAKVEDVYCDTLAATFEEATGLATSLTGQCAFA